MSFKLKTILGVGLIEAVLLLILILTSLKLLRTTKEEELIKQANNTAMLFATTTKDAVLATDLAALESFVSEVMKNDSLLYARVVSDSAGQLAYKDKNSANIGTFKKDSSIAAVNDGIYDTSAEIVESGYTYGRVELGFSIDEIDSLIAKASSKTLAIAVLELLLSALFSFILGVYLTRQLKELKHASKAITKGDFGLSIPVKGQDELADTAKAFNSMSVQLKAMWQERDLAQRKLMALNESLEEKVKARTKQLEEAQNKALENAHRAGMADIAAGALHNIGNLINGAKTSGDLLYQKLDKGSLGKLGQANQLLADNMNNLEEFVKPGQKGEVLFQYYLSLEKTFLTEQESMKNQLQSIMQSIELTAQTIAEQQQYARQNLRFESEFSIACLLDEVIDLILERSTALKIKVNKNYVGREYPVQAQKNKLHQVLLNVLINAVDAIEELYVDSGSQHHNAYGFLICQKITYVLCSNTYLCWKYYWC